MSFLTRIFGQPHSADLAKERLQLVLAHDRMNIPPATLNALKDEIITVISHHVDIDRANVQVEVARSAEGNRLVMNIPVLGLRAAREAKATAARSARGRKTR
ncbi:MAG: cell division topological specificity factor MinE [Chloroflexi bacterium]|nr:cell division topological specificity factor MinE [Chloroflexota bacterium]